GIHGAGESPKGAASRNRLLRGAFPGRATPSGDICAAALRRVQAGYAAGGLDGSDDQPVAVSSARAGGWHFWRSRRNLGAGRKLSAPPGRRAATNRGYTARLAGSPAPDRTEHALGPVLGHDDGPVHRQVAMKLRRAGFGAGVDYDHGPVFGFRQVQFEAPRLARGDIGFDVGSEPVGIVAV